ncbi:hypothetical protein D3C85_1680050 [compost metagenome]
MRVLSAGDDVEQQVRAVSLPELLQLPGARVERGLGPCARDQMRVQRGVVRIGGVGARVVDEIAVQVDIVFGGAGVVGVAIRIQRMHQHHVHVVRQRPAAVGVQPG